MHTVRTRWGHGEKDKLELYEDGEFGTRPGRTRFRPGIDRYGPLWRCHIAPAKPNGPIPFDSNDKQWNLTDQYLFFICYWAHTDIYRVYIGSCPAWYRALRAHTVIACHSHRVITVCIPLPLKYVLPLWNMYCHSEICIAAPKYVLTLRNMYWHSEICIDTSTYVIQTACTRSQTITIQWNMSTAPRTGP